MKVIPYSVWKLVDDSGRIPVDEFLQSVRDKKTRGRILSHIDRMECGLLGDWKEVGGIYELRLSFSPGYRIYYGILETVHIVLADGSDKSDQSDAIATAKSLYAALLNHPDPMALLVPWGDPPQPEQDQIDEEQNGSNGTTQL